MLLMMFWQTGMIHWHYETVSSSLSKTLNEISKKQDTVVTQTNLQSALILAQKIMAGGADLAIW